MKITDLLSVESIDLTIQATNKKELIHEMVNLMDKGGRLQDVKKYEEDVLKREAESTTGVGNGIAIPHARSAGVKEAGLSAAVVKQGVEFASLDGAPVTLAFMIAAPDNANNTHLELLSRLSTFLMDDDFVVALQNAKTSEAFLKLISDKENEKEEKEVVEHPDYLAVTACPTGIAHTYMAAEALEKTAKKKGLRLKVETRGSSGAKNVLTAQEIEQAKVIIVAADTNVPMNRFHGKKVIQVPVSDGINKPDELLDRAVAGKANIYEQGGDGEIVSDENEGMVHQIYKHLMNGVSHMLPFVVGGGILIALSFLIDGFSVDINSLSAEARSNFGTITEQAAMFKNIGGAAFGLMLPVLAGYIAMSIADRPGLAVGFVGGALAAAGTSGFLGALVAGFLAGYLVLGIKKVCKGLPSSLDGLVTILIIPVFGILLIGVLMNFVVEPPVGALNTMINQGLSHMNGASKLLLGALLGGMMAVDMGGPINKAAYVFGTASIAAGNYDIMAAVMIGGMVPPCAIALSTLLFKNKFTKDERKAGPTNFIMGLSFITEGAIPFAASDPLRVIPSCVVGSAIAGMLSMLFECTLMAPHGGIFVFPVVGNGLFYLLALVVGTIVSAIILGTVKKKVA